jgi:hypothetical protein
VYVARRSRILSNSRIRKDFSSISSKVYSLPRPRQLFAGAQICVQ